MDAAVHAPSPDTSRPASPWWPRAALAVVCAAFVAHGLHYRFLQDDAFIFFRYADNWARGWGPVWNHGEWVEGYTSPAWLALLTLIRIVAGSFEPWVHVLSLSLGVLTLAVVAGLTGAIAGSRWAGVAAALILGADRTFAVWSAAGMETRLFGLAVIAAAWLVQRRSAGPRPALELVALGPALLLVCLSRPEGFLFAGCFLVFLAVRDARALLRFRPSLLGLGLFAGGIVAHLGWRWVTYSDLLPNTFYAKVGGLDFASGAAYLADFFTSFPIVGAAAGLAILAHVIAAIRVRRVTFTAALAVICALYVTAITAIGGGFMEFRLLDPVGAPAAVLVVTALWSLRGFLGPRLGPLAAASVVVAVAAADLNHGLRFEDHAHTVMTRSEMWDGSTRAWIVVGRFFGRIARPGESLATTAAGAIPYFSGMPCVDMLGLNDRFIAHLPPSDHATAGHLKHAPESYLERRKITFILGHPRLYLVPKPQFLQPGEFLVRVAGGETPPFYLAVRTTENRAAVIASLRRRGVEVYDPAESAGAAPAAGAGSDPP